MTTTATAPRRKYRYRNVESHMSCEDIKVGSELYLIYSEPSSVARKDGSHTSYYYLQSRPEFTLRNQPLLTGYWGSWNDRLHTAMGIARVVSIGSCEGKTRVRILDGDELDEAADRLGFWDERPTRN